MDEITELKIRENAEAEHLLLTPVRWALRFVKFILAVLFCITVLGYNASMWIIGCGSMGIRARQVRASHYALHEDGYATYADYTVFLNTRDLSVKDKSPAMWLDGGMPDDYRRLEGYTYFQSLGVAVIKPDPTTYPIYPIFPFCTDTAKNDDPGHRLRGWFNRSQTVFDRKSSVMQEAFVTGAASVTALRTTLTELKMHRDPRKVLSPIPGQIDSLCHVDPFDVTKVSDAAYERWVQETGGIVIEAPMIRLRIVSTTATRKKEFGGRPMISGMCLMEECDTHDLSFYVTKYADLFYKVPPLSPAQELAVNALNSLADEEFWLRTAHQNGVYNDAVVKAMAAETRAAIAGMIDPDKAPDRRDELTPLGQDLTDTQSFPPN